MLRKLLGLLLLAIACAAGLGGWASWRAGQPLAMQRAVADFSIPAGATLRMASRQIEAAGIGVIPWHMELMARLRGMATRIKAGSYEVESGITLDGLLDKITRGDVSTADLTVLEGWTFRQFRAALDASPDLKHDTAGKNDAEILTLIGAAETRGEGLFFPDTYAFARNSSDVAVLRRAYQAMATHLQREWAARSPESPYADPYQALIMASIVEKETGRAQDRPMIAAVFANRLRTGMLLQTDPTVIYGMGARFDGNLRKADLLTDTPYNTYTRRGLPPTPIALPGLASIRAAMQPARSNALYFVARGDGSSEFSGSLAEHNRAVERFQKAPTRSIR